MKELKTTNHLKKHEVHENRKNGQEQEPWRTDNCTNILLATVGRNLTHNVHSFFHKQYNSAHSS
jgi:hypothetical protein